MDRRIKLQRILEGLFGDREKNVPHVYFQPPETTAIQYPCIIYARDYGDTQFGDNNPYMFTKRYQVTVIDRTPDTPLVDKVAGLPMCTYQRHYTSDNLNHDVFNLYY